MAILTRYQVREMSEADIPQVADIEHESFPTTWPQTAYRRELSNNLARYIVLVDCAQTPPPDDAPQPRRSFLDLFRRKEAPQPTNDYIVGYVGMWLMVDQAHIVAIAVRDTYRGRGLGELLLAEAIDLALANHQESVTLEVRKSNEVAQALYEKYRFLKVGVRRRYYSDNHEDAIVMTTPPIRSGSYQEHLDYLRGQRERRLSGTS
jgi:[ribosomal protein S18]-alanine N-acetyltransferase